MFLFLVLIYSHLQVGHGESDSVLLWQVHCGEPLVDRSIEEKIDQFYSWVEKHPGKRGQVQDGLGAVVPSQLMSTSPHGQTCTC